MKRKNPKTNKDYVRGDKLPNGRIFWAHKSGKTNVSVDKQGYFYTTSIDGNEYDLRLEKQREKSQNRDREKEREKRLSREFPKRPNPITNQLHKIGDGPNDDGLYFLSYNIRYASKIHSGFAAETWTEKDKVEFERKHRSERATKKYHEGRKLVEKGINFLRKNSETGEPFEFGYKRDDGFIFFRYDYKNSTSEGEVREEWIAAEEFHTMCISRANTRIKRKCKENKIIYDLDTNFLKMIYPLDGICPVLGVFMNWGIKQSEYANSPSLDRFDPSKGYIKENVSWISMRANAIKRDASVEEVEKIFQWMKTKIL